MNDNEDNVNIIPGRAQTSSQKRDLLLRLLSVWLNEPNQRLGQLISNGLNKADHLSDFIFFAEDEVLIGLLEDEFGEKKNEE